MNDSVRPNGNGDRAAPLSWRDVYHAVERSEDRILERMDEQTDEIKKALSKHERRILDVEMWQAETSARDEGRLGLWGDQRIVFVTLLAGLAAVVSIANFILDNVV